MIMITIVTSTREQQQDKNKRQKLTTEQERNEQQSNHGENKNRQQIRLLDSLNHLHYFLSFHNPNYLSLPLVDHTSTTTTQRGVKKINQFVKKWWCP